MGAVIRAHIRIEGIVIQFVEFLLKQPSQLKRMNLEFEGYVSLALALGLNEEYGSSLRALGSLRNRFAHSLGTSLDASTVNNLYSALAPKEKDQVQASLSRIRAREGSAEIPKSYSQLGAKDQFQLVAMVMWTSLQSKLLKTKLGTPAGA